MSDDSYIFKSPRQRKNPENRPLRIVKEQSDDNWRRDRESYPLVLASLAQAQATLVRAGKDSAMPHFIALVKEIERYYGIRFEQTPQPKADDVS